MKIKISVINILPITIIFLVLSCTGPETNENEATPEEPTFVDGQEAKAFNNANTGDAQACAEYLEAYGSNDNNTKIITDRLYNFAVNGTSADCDLFVTYAKKDPRVEEIKKRKEKLAESETAKRIAETAIPEDSKAMLQLVKDCIDFIKKYPENESLSAIKAKFFECVKAGSALIGKLYLEVLPDDKKADEVKKIIIEKSEQEFVDKANAETITLAECVQYLTDYPEGENKKLIGESIYKFAVSISLTDTEKLNACNEFIKFFPEDERIEDIKLLQNQLERKESETIFNKFKLMKELNWDMILKNGDYKLPKGNYQINKEIFINETGKLIIEAGVTLNFNKDGVLVCKGVIQAEGSVINKITFQGLNNKNWQNISFLGKATSKSMLRHCIIKNGAGISTKNDKVAPFYETEAEFILGGGILCLSEASPTFDNCEIMNNNQGEIQVHIFGGGVYCAKNSSPTFKNCIIYKNRAAFGGGFFIDIKSNPKFENCEIYENEAPNAAGLYISESNPEFKNSKIYDHKASGTNNYEGGAGVMCSNSSPKFADTTIENNEANTGAGVYLKSKSAPSFVNCKIINNKASFRGAGVFCAGSSTPFFDSCIITGNVSGDANFGGGIDCMDKESGPKFPDSQNSKIENNKPKDFHFE